MNTKGNLVLTRKKSEEICFTIPPSKEETTIILNVGAIKGNQIKLACHAPKRVNIVRRELLKAR